MGRFSKVLLVVALVFALGLCEQDATGNGVSGFDPQQDADNGDGEAFAVQDGENFGMEEDDGQEEADADEHGTAEDEEPEAENLEIVADGVNVIKMAEDTYKILNSYSCPPGTYKLKRKYWGTGKKGGCVCRICPKGHKCFGDKKMKCNCGTYQPNKGQRKCLNSGCGYKVPKKGLWYRIKCRHGTYAAGPKNCFCVRAKKGYYVPYAGKCGQKKCGKGFFQSCVGQHRCIPCIKGYEVSTKHRKFCNKKYPKYY